MKCCGQALVSPPPCGILVDPEHNVKAHVLWFISTGQSERLQDDLSSIVINNKANEPFRGFRDASRPGPDGG